MDFSYSEEQCMLRDNIARFVSQEYGFDSRRNSCSDVKGYSTEHWQLFAELGWLMVLFSEQEGGLDGNAVDLMLMMEEFGKGLVVEPFLPTVVLAGRLIAELGSETQKHILHRVMAGKHQLALAFNEPQSRYSLSDVLTTASVDDDNYIVNGHKSVVLNGANADQLLVVVRTHGGQHDRDGISLLMVDAAASGVRRQRYTTVDGFSAAEVYFDNVPVPTSQLLGQIGDVLPAIEKAIDLAAFAVSAEAVGAMEVLYKKTIEYTKTRKQFGNPLSSLQALQHRMADMFIEFEQARSIVLMAAMALDNNAGVAPKAISAAKSRVGKAARLVGQEAVQLHGGIGVTDELDIGHFFKRLTMIQYLYGSTDIHTRRFSQLL